MAHLYLIFLLCSCIYAACTALNINQNATLTTPDVCVRQFECPTGSFCSLTEPGLPQYRCMPSRNAGDECPPFLSDATVCKDGLYCSRTTRKCTAQSTINSATTCDPNELESCKTPSVCDRISRTCRATRPVMPDEDCAGDDDCPENNICQSVWRGRRAFRCTPSSPIGTSCGITQDDPLCAPDAVCSDAGLFLPFGRCTPRRLPGERCLLSRECADGLECVGGRCLPPSRILKALGAPCWTVRDRCDPARGMTCAWSSVHRRHVCQQLQRLRIGTIGRRPRGLAYRACTPESDLSSCRFSRSGAREVCRTPIENQDGLYGCARPVVTLRPGENCDVPGFGDHVTCANGATCSDVPGVAGGHRACVRTKEFGVACGWKFANQCAPGLQCAANGTCAMLPSVPFRPTTHSSLGSACNPGSRPCVPGAQCVQDECQLPEVVRSEGEFCIDSPRRNVVCSAGLVCRPTGWLRLLKCSLPVADGGVCQETAECTQELQCGPPERSFPFSKRCFDPETELALGAACDPNNGRKRCVRTKLTSKGGPQEFATMCLPATQDGNATEYTCAVPVRVMESCTNTFRCFENGVSCTSYGVCL